jgi:hypothetical protein
MGTISVVCPLHFKGMVHVKKIKESDGIILKMAGPAVQPPPQVLVVNMFLHWKPAHATCGWLTVIF